MVIKLFRTLDDILYIFFVYYLIKLLRDNEDCMCGHVGFVEFDVVIHVENLK